MDEDSTQAPVFELPETYEDTTAPRLSPWQRWIVEREGFIARFVPLIIATGFIAVGIVMWLTGQFQVTRIGLAGIWFFSFVGAASVFIPVPGTAAACIGAAPAFGLYPPVIGIVAGSAEALGEMTGYLTGMSGKNMLERNRFYPRFRDLLLRRGGIVLFLSAVIPNPLFDVMGIAAGSILYPVRKFLLYVFLAKAIKSTMIAYACYLGISWIQRWAG